MISCGFFEDFDKYKIICSDGYLSLTLSHKEILYLSLDNHTLVTGLKLKRLLRIPYPGFDRRSDRYWAENQLFFMMVGGGLSAPTPSFQVSFISQKAV